MAPTVMFSCGSRADGAARTALATASAPCEFDGFLHSPRAGTDGDARFVEGAGGWGAIVRLKICKVVDRATAFDLMEAGVDYLGFHVLSTADDGKEATAAAINRELRGTGYGGGVLLTKSKNVDWIRRATITGAFQFVQLHRGAELNEIVHLATQLDVIGAQLIQVVDPAVRSTEYIDEVLKHAAFVLYDNYTGGTGRQISNAVLERVPADRAFIAGGINEVRACELRDEYRPYALDVQSWVDHRDHTKDMSKVEALLRVVRSTR